MWIANVGKVRIEEPDYPSFIAAVYAAFKNS